MGGQLFEGAERRQYFMLPADQIILVGLDTPHKSKAEHFLFDARVHLPVDPIKVENVRKHGIIKAVIVRKIDGKAYGVDGRQRVKWAREATRLNKAERGKPVLVPCIERKGSDEQLWSASRSANAVSERPDPLVIASEIADLVNMGVPEAEIAVDYAFTVAQVKDHLRLHEDLSPRLRPHVTTGALTITAAKQFFGLPHEEQDQKFEGMLAEGGKITVERARAATRNGSNGHGKPETVGLKLKQIHKLFSIAAEHLGPRDVKILGILCGKNKPREIAGMTEALREIGFDLDD
jgi:ParB-like chromosome segregation protein Spo0J